MTKDGRSEPSDRTLHDSASAIPPHEGTSEAEPLESPQDNGESIVFARYKEGLASEAERISHVLSMPSDGTVPDALIALCGKRFPPGVLEALQPWAGMPCLSCTLNMPTEPATDS